VCGTTVSTGGLIQAKAQGVPVHIADSAPVTAGLSEWPVDEDLYTLCPSCARVYRESVIEETGTAPVAFRVDVTAGPIGAGVGTKQLSEARTPAVAVSCNPVRA